MFIEINEDKYRCKVWINEKPQGASAGQLWLGEKLPSKGRGKFDRKKPTSGQQGKL